MNSVPQSDELPPPEHHAATPQNESNEQMQTLSVLRLISAQPDLTQRQLASLLGISLGKTNFIIRAVLGRGWIKVENFRRSNNKIGYIYILTPQGISQRLRLTQTFIARKEWEYEQLRSEIDRLRAEISPPTA